jgi:hypothetical protein
MLDIQCCQAVTVPWLLSLHRADRTTGLVKMLPAPPPGGTLAYGQLQCQEQQESLETDKKIIK